MVIVGPGLDWFFDHATAQSAVWNVLPLISIAVVSLKFAAAAFIVSRLHARRVLDDGALIAAAFAWLAGVALIYGILSWFLTDVMTPAYLKATIAILLMPLSRLSAAPLALAWSRHR